MANRFEGLMINRLLVLVQIVLIPVYFVFFQLRWQEEISGFFEDFSIPYLLDALPHWFIWFETNLAIPLFFSFPWVVFSILRATRIADAYELMGRALGKVRIDQKLFYGINAAFTLVFLIFPFFSPIITIIGIFWAVRVILRKLWIGKIGIVWFVPAVILAIVPGMIAIAFYSNYVVLFEEIILATWVDAIPVLFGWGLSLAIAISIGNFMLFLFEGSVKYGGYKEIPYGFILVVKTFIFFALALIYPQIPDIVNFINYIAVALGFFEIVMRRVRDLPAEGEWKSGIVMVIAFSLVNILINFIRHSSTFIDVIQTIVIVVSGLIFFALFAISYFYADDEELFV
jgi:hypothetical protein